MVCRIIHQIQCHWDEIEEEVTSFGLEVTLEKVYLLLGNERVFEAKMSSKHADAHLQLVEIER